MAKAKKPSTTPQPPEANPHFIGRFSPTKLTVSPLYRAQHDSLETMTLRENRQYRYLQAKAERAGLSETPPPSSHRGKKKPDEDILPRLESYVHKAEHEGLSRTRAVRRWVTETKKGKQLSEKALKAIIARLMRKMRQREKARARLMPP
jgi:hypothetical protein